MSGAMVWVRFDGGRFDGRTREAEGLAAQAIHLPVMMDDGRIVIEVYEWTAHGTHLSDICHVYEYRGVLPPPNPVEDDEPEPDSIPLDPELAPYLDWPLYFPDDSVHCDKFPDCQNRYCRDPESGQVYIASGRRMTVREFLADIKAHAEGTQP